jgi:four helix bundle protein
MATVKRFEDLEIWQMARELENKVFEETQKGKLSKDYKLKDQMNSAAGSIMDNIAEGFGRGSRLEFVQFLSISKGQVMNYNLNYTDAWTENTINKKNLRSYMHLLIKFVVKSLLL